MRRFAVIFTIAFLSSCAAPGPQPVNQTGQQVPARPGGATAPATAPSGESGAGSGVGAPTAPSDDKVAKLQAEYAKRPTDEALKKELADATMENADYYMYSSNLSPREKYPKALKLYREVAKLDPTNKKAQDSIAIIEDIYRQMGRPVPEA